MENKQSNLQIVSVDQDGNGNNDEALPPGISVAKFDYSVENHLKAMDKILELSGEPKFKYDQPEIQQMSSSVSFLREWRHFCYQPQAIGFACQTRTPGSKDVTGGIINLPQFSSAAVPKELSGGNTVSSHLSKDFVMYAGGLVWALDWCPRVHQRPDCDPKLEIWGHLNPGVKDDDVISQVKVKPKKNSSSTQKPRGRPKKNPVSKPVNLYGDNQHLHDQVVQFPEDSTKLLLTDGISQDTLELVAPQDTDTNVKPSAPKKSRGRPKKNITLENVPGADTTPAGVSTEQELLNSGSTGAIHQNSSRPKRPKKSPKSKGLKESISNKDSNSQYLEPLAIKYLEDNNGSNQYLKPLSIKYPEDSSKLLEVDEISTESREIVSTEGDGSSYSDFGAGASHKDQQQNPKGSDANVVKFSARLKCKKDRKKATDEAVDNSNCSIQHVQALAVELADDSSKSVSEEGTPSKIHGLVTKKDYSRKRKGHDKGHPEKPSLTVSKLTLTKCKSKLKSGGNATDLALLSPNVATSSDRGQDPMRSSEDKANPAPLQTDLDSCYISENVALPRLVMCLAHNGKVAWDVKWRPFDAHGNSKHRMGYLAVLLGNGALEVWEVPVPRAAEVMFSACQKEGTDPRFIKLEPVFRCSKLKCGDRQSIPLTMEWSTSSPHDLILTGCHDGVVALWKFSADGPLKDTRPLLCFNADTEPIRALAWAPVVSDSESANIVVTAGSKGAKFWDIRDPYRPLWDSNPVQKIVYCLDWIPNPRCIVLSYDDGEMKIISLSKAASDVPVTGKPFAGTQLQGLNSYYCSSSSIWGVQVSRLTGMVAYCCSDGTVLHFQLTTRSVEKDRRENRVPHYLCGAVTVEDSALIVLSPLPDVPFPMKKSFNEWSNTPRSRRGFLAISNQKKRDREQMLKSQTPEERPLAICYNNGPGSDSGSDDVLADPTSKTKSDSKKNPKKTNPQASTCVYEVPDTKNVKDHNMNEVEKEVLPPKIVAMHCVRWNMNKGSERWLCYGGAAGILRCQEIGYPGN